jgi:D-amino-acid dehydrogenase
MALHVVVIGAGIVGVSTALELLNDGHRVTLVEPGAPGGEQAASYGNAAWLSPASIIPMSMPGLWRKVPGYLLDRESPLTIRWRKLPRLMPWLLRFLLAGATVAKVERTARILTGLLHDAPARHAALAAMIGQPDLVQQRGLLYPYPDRAAFQAEALGWRLRHDNGFRWQELEGGALRQQEPALASRYTFGIFLSVGAHCVDPGGYVAALAAHAVQRGAVLAAASATGFAIKNGRLRGVLTDAGRIDCDRAVIAAGIHSKVLARLAGDTVPLESERGYHVMIAAPTGAPYTPVMPSDGKMGNTTMRAGLRAAGQVELASVEAPPDWRRADILLRHALSAYPGIGTPDDSRITRWMGHRPSTPDGLPVIAPSTASPDIVHAFGHGHIGLVAGPMTGRLAADLAGGLRPRLDVAPFAAKRF